MSQTRTEIVIEPTHGFRLTSWRELVAYRDLLWLLVWRDFTTRYKQTLLGPLWHLLQPLVTTLVFTMIFSHVAGLSTDGLPATLFYLCGLLAWNYFSQTFNSTSNSLVGNANLLSKVYFPRLIVPLSCLLSNLVTFLVQFAMFWIVYGLYRASHPGTQYGPRWEALAYLPLVLLQLAALSLGTGLWLAALTAKFRDFIVLAGFLIQLWMYVTPVIYPLSKVPPHWRLFVAVNPVAVPVESFRYLLLGSGSISLHLFAVSIAGTLVSLVTGLFAFRRAERIFVDTV